MRYWHAFLTCTAPWWTSTPTRTRRGCGRPWRRTTGSGGPPIIPLHCGGPTAAWYRRRRPAAIAGDPHEAHPEIRIELVFRQLFREKGVDASLEQSAQAGQRFRALSTEYIRLYGGARELLCALRAQGCGVWLLSNAQSIFTTRELDRLGLTDCFNGIYLSSDYGVKKPDRRFFDALLHAQGIQPDRAVMIGNDGLCDIRGGREAGLDTIYIRSNLSPNEPEPEADYTLDRMDLEQVGKILLDRRFP